MNNKKQPAQTPYFYFAILAIVIGLGACYYHYYDLQKTIQQYITAGYDTQTVASYFPLVSIIPTLSQTLASYGILSAILFGLNSVIKKMRCLEAFASVFDFSEEEDEEGGCTCGHCAHEADEEGTLVASAEPKEEVKEQIAQAPEQTKAEASEDAGVNEANPEGEN